MGFKGFLAETLYEPTSPPSTTAGLQEIEPMKKTLSLLLFVVLAWPPLVFGEEKLAGVNEIRVFVSGFDKERERDGFNSETYKNAVELRFRQLGIPVVDEFSDSPSDDFLLRGTFVVGVNSMKIDENQYAVSLVTYLIRYVYISDGQEFETTSAYVWEGGSLHVLGMKRIESFKEDVIDSADDFANDYLKANPPEPRSGQESE
jgi:hypothetical protein